MSKRLAPFRRLAVLAAAFFLLAPAQAQDFRGSIEGVVTDSQGGRSPGRA